MDEKLTYAQHKLNEAIQQGEPDETIAYWRGYRDCAKALQQTWNNVATGCKPLTPEQLHERDGRPVWSKKHEEWFLICKMPYGYMMYDRNGFCLPARDFVDYGLYDHHPAHIEREAWNPCDKCVGCGNCYYFLYDDDEYPCDKCLKYATKKEPYSKFTPIAFCKHCGRPLTDGAWLELEKRLMGCM